MHYIHPTMIVTDYTRFTMTISWCVEYMCIHYCDAPVFRSRILVDIATFQWTFVFSTN